MPPTLELETLGGLDLHDRSGVDTSRTLARPKDLSVLVYVAIATPFGFHPRDTLLPLFWPESDEQHARGALSQVLYRLRRDLGKGTLLGRGHDIGISTDRMAVDVRRFQASLEEGDRVGALRLYRGHLLEGFHVSGSRGWERWLDRRRAELARKAVAAAVELADQADEDGNTLSAVRWLRRGLEISSLDESILRRLLETQSRAGDRAGALQTYEAFIQRLRREFDLDPAEETAALARSIRRGELPSSAGTGSPEEPGDRPAEHPDGRPTGSVSDESRAPIRSLAVLPFRSRTDAPDSTILADGIAEVLVSRLGRIGALRLISNQTTERYRQSEASLAEIARDLGVDGVITGSLSQPAETVELRVQLIRVHPEEQLWGQGYSWDIREAPRMHGEIAREIARAVQVTLTEDERARLSTARSVDPDAYQAYLKGRHFALIPGAVDQALQHFREAIHRDPGYAPPYAGLAIVYGNLTLYAYMDPDESGPAAGHAVDQALALDSTLSEAHAARSLVLALFDHDWKEAEEEIRRAIRLNPSSALAWSYLGAFLASGGAVAEASTAAREAATLDPAGPWTNFVQAWTTYRCRSLESALTQFRDTLELEPRIAICHGFMTAILSLLRRPDEASIELERGLQKAPSDQIILGYGASALGQAGEKERSRELLARLEEIGEERYLDPFYLAAARLGVDDRGGALDALEEATDRSAAAMFLKTDPLFDPLRSDGRFRKLLERLDFPGRDRSDTDPD